MNGMAQAAFQGADTGQVALDLKEREAAEAKQHFPNRSGKSKPRFTGSGQTNRQRTLWLTSAYNVLVLARAQ
jgi:hypothetical protein